jgi:Fur family transcriptional regulator, ferric uptake regulator
VQQPNPVLSALGDAGKRLTVARRAVAEAIAEQAGHFTAEDVLAAARSRRRAVARATVFRSLDLLVDLGLVERVDLPSGDHAYVACEPDAHHHHVVCSACGRSVEVGELGLRPILERIESSTGFVIDTHRLELFGLCPECRAAAAFKRSA